MYEQRHTPPIAARRFARRMLAHIGAALALVAFSLALGMAGYAYFERMSWRDAFLNSAMLLGGMGPVKTEGLSEAGKIFAGLYALYAGLVFIAVISILLAPIIHRALHQFHWAKDR